MRRGRRAIIAACVFLAVAAAPAAALAQTVDELYASGVKARQAQHFDEAAELLRRALALKPDNADALVQLGFAELGRNDLPAAREAFSRALSLAPAYLDASFGLAEVEFRSGNLDAALPLAEKVSRAEPGNADAAVLVANIREAQQAGSNNAKPATAGKKPLPPRPDPVAGLMEEGRRLRASGQLPEAEKAGSEVCKIPGNLGDLGNVAKILDEFRRFEDCPRLPSGNVANAEVEMRNAEVGSGNAECGRKGNRSQCDKGL